MYATTLLSSIFILTTSTAARLLPPQPPHPYILPRTTAPTPSTQEKCTFTLWHKQISTNPSKNYIYLPTLTDHANNLVIDISATKPAQESNSYTRLSATQKYSIAGLLGGDALTIGARDDGDVLVFEMRGLIWEAGGEEEEFEGGV